MKRLLLVILLIPCFAYSQQSMMGFWGEPPAGGGNAPTLEGGARKAIGSGTADPLVSSSFTTAGASLIVALVSHDGGAGSTNTVVSWGTGGNGTWVLQQRNNTAKGCTEIWTATSTIALTGTNTVSADIQDQGIGQTGVVWVYSVLNANTTFTVAGASNNGGAASDTAATLTVAATESLVLAVGEDWTQSGTRTYISGQSQVDYSDFAGFITAWSQQLPSTSSTGNTTIGTTNPATTDWNFSVIEIKAL